MLQIDNIIGIVILQSVEQFSIITLFYYLLLVPLTSNFAAFRKIIKA